MKIFLLIVLNLFIYCSLYAQDYVFEKLSTRDGLSQNDVNCIFQDREGFLWIGTNDGLNRYDGYSFKTFRIDQDQNYRKGLSSNLVFRVKEDQKGNLWIATSNEGICKFNLETEVFTQIRNKAKDPLTLLDNRVLDLECMADGSVWVATMKGINIITEENQQIKISVLDSTVRKSLAGIINCLSEDREGRKWFGLGGALGVYEQKGQNAIVTMVHKMSGVDVRSVIPLPEGEVIGTNAGVFLIQDRGDGINFNVHKISNVNTRKLIVGKNGMIYASSNHGLYIFSLKSFLNAKIDIDGFVNKDDLPLELKDELVMSLFEDASGIVWIGTKGGGLIKYNPKQKKFRHYQSTSQPGSLSENKIRAIYEDSKQNIWIGTEGGGINYLDHSKNRNFNSGFVNYSFGVDAIENNVYSILEVNEGKSNQIWAGAGYPKLLAKYALSAGKVTEISGSPIPSIKNSVFALMKDNDDNIWLGTYGSTGLFKYEKTASGYRLLNFKTNELPGSISSNIIRSLLQDKKGNIWIGTDAGLNLLSQNQIGKEKPHFRVFRNIPGNKRSLSNDYVLPLFESKEGDVWVGTMGGGLNKINFAAHDSVSFTSFNTKDGFPNNVIKGILEDNYGFLWISTNKGLTRFDPKDTTCKNFDVSDGLQDFEFGELACCKLSDGMMVFGGVNGINTFYPEQITTDMSLPKLVFTDLQILNQSVHVGDIIHHRVVLSKGINFTDEIKLKSSENSFAIYFSSLHFSAPQKNMFKYKLEGFDPDWIQKSSDERFAKYTNLKPGKYVFKLLASNNDGVWAAMPRLLSITIVPPWYKSNMALLTYFILFGWLFWFFQRYSIIRIKQKNGLLMEHFEKQKIEELTQMKLRFYTNISHEFRTPLTLIIGSVDRLIKLGRVLPEDIQNKHSVIQRNSAILLRLINQLVDFRKFEQGKMQIEVSNQNIVIFLQDIYHSFLDLAGTKNIDFQFKKPQEDIFLWIDSDKVEKIVYNLLSNAFKVTPNGGQIEIRLEEDNFAVFIRVIDTGRGMSEEVQRHLFERFYQAKGINDGKLAGTGIGLSFSKGIAELLHGDIRFSSVEGVGSTFELMLLKGKDHFSASEIVDSPALRYELNHTHLMQYDDSNSNIDHNDEKDDSKEIDNSKNTLLIVEDNPDLRNFLSESFREKYNVFVAENGEQGINMAIEQYPDLIISDIRMPIKDGIELCSQIKGDEQLSHIPVILLTAKSSAEDTITGLDHGADAYVVKPFDFDVLAAQVKNLIRSREKLRIKLRSSVEVVPSEVTTTSMDEKFLSRMLKIIEEHISDFDFTVEKLSELYGMSQINMNKKLKSLTGLTTNVFIRNVRLKRAAQLLRTGRYSVADVTYEVGFSDLKYFRSCFKLEFGVSPSSFIKQNKAE